jgi:hypothetical protein
MRGAFHLSCGDRPRTLRRAIEKPRYFGASCDESPGTRRAHSRNVSRSSTDRPGTEVFVVDSSPAVALALGAHRPSEESTYVLCRAASERGPDFSRRVLKRVQQIQAHRCIGSLWYVVGSKSFEPTGSVGLLEELLPLLERGARVTLATPRSFGSVVFGWVDTLLGRTRDDVNMGVRFYPDISELRRGAAPSALSSQQQCA